MSDEYEGPTDREGNPLQPIGWQGSGPDFEVSGPGPFEWEAYDEELLIGRGRARTKLGLLIAMARFQRHWRREEART